MVEHTEEGVEQGFTLIELLIAIVVVGILAAVAVVGVASLTKKGEESACATTKESAQAAQAVYFADHAALPAPETDYPADAAALVASGELELSGGATVAANVISGSGWTMTATGGSAAPLVFTCP